MRPAASVAIINYNGRRFLEELFQGLGQQSMSPLEILFVDNASSDGSLEYVRSAHPNVRMLPQSRNLGFAAAGNLAVRESEGEFVALLNTDLKLHPHWLEELLIVGSSEADVAAVASKMLLYDQPDRLNGVGGVMNRLGYTWDRGMFEPDRGQYDETAEVLFASAGAALFRKQAFIASGGFDERFFMYHEDVDLCWRLWLFGYRVLTAPKAVVHHHFGGTTRAEHGLRWRELLGERNNIRALLKNYQLGNAARVLFELFLLKQPWERKKGQLRNFVWNLGALADTLRLRRMIQKRRRRTDQEIKYLIVQSRDVPIAL